MAPDAEALIAIREEFVSLKDLAERAVAQLDDQALFAALDGEANSVALLVKHVGGNLRSRWTDPFTTDGEKPDRQRDREFEREPGDSRDSLVRRWEEGWGAVLGTLDRAAPSDLTRLVRIRGAELTFARALTRSLAHTAGHVHQIILLARHWRAGEWQTLSIPRRKREASA
jgi:hypothetical protein